MDKTAQWVIIATTSAGVLTTVATFAFQIYRENRNRRWDKEDQQETARALAKTTVEEANRVAERVLAEAHLVADRVVAEAKIVAAEANSERAKLAEAIRENTEVSTQAFKEANTVNRKIASLGLEHNALQEKDNALQREKQENESKEK
jgi:hypothetical protein